MKDIVDIGKEKSMHESGEVERCVKAEKRRKKIWNREERRRKKLWNKTEKQVKKL